MIKTLSLTNFRKHSNTILEFCEGVNVIIGETGQGKSSIVKGLRWLILNKPQGNKIVKRGENECQTMVTFVDGIDVIKARKKTNKYIVNNITYSAFGNDMPQDVQDVVRMTGINFQNQFDSHYLLSDSAGEIAKQINECVNLESIDLYISKINSVMKDNSVSIEKMQSEIERIENMLLDYMDAEQDSIALESIKTLDNEITKSRKQIRYIASITKEIESIKPFDQEDLLIDDLLSDISKMETTGQEITDHIQTCKTMKGTIDKIKLLQKSIDISDSKKIEYQQTLKTILGELNVCPICETVFQKTGQEIRESE